jgi:ATP/maltotriose-dependent transcriptional regulator MalT
MAGIASAGSGIPLLTTKLFVPRARPDLVVRPRLLAGLVRDGARCTLLAAQAGAGKTSLLAAWLAEHERAAAWLSLDERDQDEHRFVRYLAAALQTVAPGCGHTALSWLDGPSVPIDAVLTSLLNDAAALPPGTLLVLDDYHLVRSRAVHDAVAFLLDHLPPTLHLVISTREDPPLPMARLRGRGELVELRAADLGFTVDEACDLLVAGMGRMLSRQQVATLVAHTEGWAAGLQLAGLALRSRPDVAGFVAAFAGSHRLIADYLTAEVLDRQPATVQRFLLATCVLDRMCAPLCDAVVGEPGSQRVLEELERANLFVIPLDDERTWFRYHHLFAEVLRARAARYGDAGLVAAHRGAGAWLGAAGLLPEAIEHALAAGDVDDAAARVESVVPMMLAQFEIHRAMEGWLDAFPEATVRARPMLCLARAWLLIHIPRPDEANSWIDAAESTLPAGEAGRRLRGAAAALRALACAFTPAIAPATAHGFAERALADLPAENVGFRVVAGIVKG